MKRKLPELDLQSIRQAYQSGDWTPGDLVFALDEKINESEPSAIWISRLSHEQLLEHAQRVEAKGMEGQPLYGVPFAIKDNIDLEGLPTTAACPEYAYQPKESAFAAQKLIDAGAIPIGKTNLDQFATGLVGVRSPYGFPANSIDSDYIPGGSSSGSAIAVARGFSSFSLGTDTAGSGRIPAAFNALVGLKPTRGILSCSGVVPACKTLDCVSIFAGSPHDAQTVLEVAASFDISDPWARADPALAEATPLGPSFRFGVPRDEQLEFFGNESAQSCFLSAIEKLEAMGGERITIDFQPFLDAARLLYEGPWVAERFVVIEEILSNRPEILHPVTRSIIEGGANPGAADAFKSQYRLAELKRTADSSWQTVDLIVTPTAGTIYTSAEVEADPIQLNSNLGYYTNFMNLLDYSAVAVPAGDLDTGLPFGVTFFAEAFHDRKLLDLSARFREQAPLSESPACPEGWSRIAVCGAHMKGLPLNHQLTERMGRFLSETRTSANYRLYALPPTEKLPPRPGLVRDEFDGLPIDVEIWALPDRLYGDFVVQIPSPLGIGKIELDDGSLVSGFLCEPYALTGAEEITSLGGWRSFVSA